MKNVKIYDAITEIRTDIIEHAEEYQFKKKTNWIKWASLAASFVVLIGLGVYIQVKSAVVDYAGPVLPLTTLSDATGVSVVRNISLDFAPYRQLDGNYKKVVRVGDEYILTNETEEDIRITTIYGFVGSLIDDIGAIPEIYFDGKMKEKEIYIGEGLSDYDNWQAFEELLSDNRYIQEALDISEMKMHDKKLERDKKYEAYKIISFISDEMIYKELEKQGVSMSDLYHMKRVMYVTYDVVVPANDNITLNIYMDKYGSYETYDIMTMLGSEFEFEKQTATVKNSETVIVKEQDFGFEFNNKITEVELDMNKSCYSISVEKNDEKIWRTIKKLGYNVIPKPKAEAIEARILEDRIFIYVYGIDKEYFQNYIKKCVNRYKFKIDIERTEYSFEAYNTDGYHLIADFSDGGGTTMFILLDKPISFGEYEIPQFAIEQGLPIPKSDLGSYSWNNSEEFSLKIGNISGEEYLSYIEECKKAGFVNNTYDNYPIYSADNENGYALHLRWEGNNTFNITFGLVEN